jgi:hypothetical protein
MSRFFSDLGHPDQVLIVLEIIECRRLVIKLITQDDCQVPDPRHTFMTPRHGL